MGVRDRWRLLRRLANAIGRDLVTRNYYSPIPAWEQLPAEVFERRGDLTGINSDTSRQVEFLHGLSPFLDEFQPPDGFDWSNNLYGSVEADVLYALVRHAHPKRIIELGSGFSSLIIASAAERNSADGYLTSYAAYDPYPREFISSGVRGMSHSMNEAPRAWAGAGRRAADPRCVRSSWARCRTTDR